MGATQINWRMANSVTKGFYQIGLLVIFIISNTDSALTYSSNPCDYHDTVNITSGRAYSNGSILHDDIIYSKDLIGEYRYEIVDDSRKAVPRYLRGCICKLKICVPLCCDGLEFVYNASSRMCWKHEFSVNRYVPIVNDFGNEVFVDMKSQFGLVFKRPSCKVNYFLIPEIYGEGDKWQLFKNGTLFRLDDKAHLPKDQYCLSPYQADPNKTLVGINPLNCAPDDSPSSHEGIAYGICMIISIPFMAITVLVYAVNPELRNLHGKCLCCYLSCLALGYFFLGYMLLQGGIISTDVKCEIFGYSTYYFFMASFLWLNVISFDLWWNFRGMSTINHQKDVKRFVIYSIYSFGLAFVFLLIVLLIQNSDSVPEDLKPGIGSNDRCFLNVDKWMALVYFYGQLLIILTLNSIMFWLTFYKIYKINAEMKKVMKKGESQKSYNKEKAQIKLFLRLFIVMGVTWMMEFIAWLGKGRADYLFWVTDVCNATQGLIIFILFVCRNRVRKLVTNNYYRARGKPPRYTLSTTRGSKVTETTNAANFNERRNTDLDAKRAQPDETIQIVDFKDKADNNVSKRSSYDESEEC